MSSGNQYSTADRSAAIALAAAVSDARSRALARLRAHTDLHARQTHRRDIVKWREVVATAHCGGDP
jgi:hypothetical protein